MKVSPLCLGCMTYGVPERGDHPWTTTGRTKPAADPEGRRVGDQLLRHCQRLFGRNLRGNRRPGAEGFHAPRRGGDRHQSLLRDEQGTKRRWAVPQSDSSPRSMRACGGSVSITWICTRSIVGITPRPIEETLEALHDVVKSRQGALPRRILDVRLAVQQGAGPRATQAAGRRSSACRISTTCCTARRSARCCRCAPIERIAVLPWSPLARGRLARARNAETTRTQTDPYADKLFAATEESDRRVVEQVDAIATAHGVPRAQVALAWASGKTIVTAPIIGASKPQHLDDAVAALDAQAERGRGRTTRSTVRAARRGRPSLMRLMITSERRCDFLT